MEPGWALVIVAVVIVAVVFVYFWLNSLAKRVVEAAWREAARALKLEFMPGGLLGRGKIRGELEGFPVKAEILMREEKEDTVVQYTRVVVDLAGRLPDGVSFTAESGRSSVFGKVFKGQDLQTGDYHFDDVVYLRGPEVPLRAALNEVARRRIVEMVVRGGTVKDGTICEERRGEIDYGPLYNMLQETAATARELTARFEDIQGALLENARGDPLPDVRLLNLKTLVQRYPASTAAGEAMTAALDDPDGRLRLLGAAALRTPGAAAILASLVNDTRQQSDVRAEALRALAESRPYAEVAPTIAAALDDADQMVQREAVALVGKFRDASLYDGLVRLGPRADDELAEAMAHALGNLGDRKAERPLLLLLARDSIAVKTAAAAALGVVGTVRAVESLLPLKKGLLESAELKEAAREAIRLIQARLGSVDEGSLSLVEGEEEGRLSLAAPAGGVSLVSEAPPRDPTKSGG